MVEITSNGWASLDPFSWQQGGQVAMSFLVLLLMLYFFLQKSWLYCTCFTVTPFMVAHPNAIISTHYSLLSPAAHISAGSYEWICDLSRINIERDKTAWQATFELMTWQSDKSKQLSQMIPWTNLAEHPSQYFFSSPPTTLYTINSYLLFDAHKWEKMWFYLILSYITFL